MPKSRTRKDHKKRVQARNSKRTAEIKKIRNQFVELSNISTQAQEETSSVIQITGVNPEDAPILDDVENYK